MTARTVTQIAACKTNTADALWALCDDGTLWEMDEGAASWTQVQGPPQPPEPPVAVEPPPDPTPVEEEVETHVKRGGKYSR